VPLTESSNGGCACIRPCSDACVGAEVTRNWSTTISRALARAASRRSVSVMAGAAGGCSCSRVMRASPITRSTGKPRSSGTRAGCSDSPACQADERLDLRSRAPDARCAVPDPSCAVRSPHCRCAPTSLHRRSTASTAVKPVRSEPSSTEAAIRMPDQWPTQREQACAVHRLSTRATTPAAASASSEQQQRYHHHGERRNPRGAPGSRGCRLAADGECFGVGGGAIVIRTRSPQKSAI
jgi:hypothetical protein